MSIAIHICHNNSIYLTDFKVFGICSLKSLKFCGLVIPYSHVLYMWWHMMSWCIYGQLAFNMNFKIDQALYTERLLLSGELRHTCTHYMHSAPVPGTVEDFWQMIWDQNIGLVVKLTKNVEGTLKKVCAYRVCILC